MMIKLTTAAAFGAAVLLANLLTDRYGMVPVLPGLDATAGTYAAGAALLIRDVLQRTAGRRWAIAAILAGGVLTWLLASPALATASVTAFLAAELVDLAVFTHVEKRHGFDAGVLASNAVSAPIDTVLFLAIAPFPITAAAVAGQVVAKLLHATLAPLALRRALAR